ncbi:hypothetical protein JCM9140_2902 [Halalkalibacter wakoensis JCM 9140]|uniref:DUF3953 domain-containing protein n=1 Tax=Halalkalibacter wakoensis JCM 9140 TaxID=1236970 RepID=W4Q3Y6_9BACI|nr:YczI family protein [Halalkalibacter wakoensis]GAE26801.1 hypothetical protein JCM9140_2902 [Halalkalibacter wakoensis JCM 9140]
MKLWMKIITTILAVTVISLSAYSLITGEHGMMPHTLLLIGMMLIFIGITELQEQRKVTGIFSFLSSGFVLFVGINGLIS